MEISFYDSSQDWYEFSNFYDKAPISIDGKIWPSSEHYYQALKYQHSPEFMEVIRNTDTCGKVYALANQKKGRYTDKWYVNRKIYGDYMVNRAIDDSFAAGIKIRDDWNDIKDRAMYFTIKQKFLQHPKLKELLLSTGNAKLIEASPRDSYWGTGRDGQGFNKLGNLLMLLRDELSLL